MIFSDIFYAQGVSCRSVKNFPESSYQIVTDDSRMNLNSTAGTLMVALLSDTVPISRDDCDSWALHCFKTQKGVWF